MRWDNLRVEAEEGRRLPGYRDPAVVRTFDAPEALDVRFYEVHAKSALNRVPKASRMPFRWTINPYRGCSHACSYCASGDTPVLMANGGTKPLEEVDVGDLIYGTAGSGIDRRFEITRVLAHWSTHKPAYRVTLGDGAELVASADHRFLAEGGWRFVAESARGWGTGPYLSFGERLFGDGGVTRESLASHNGGGAVTSPPRSLVELPVMSEAGMAVEAVEPLDEELELFDITTGTGDFIANGVVSHNCFARPTHKYLDMNAGRDFEREIVVKVNVPEVLRTELARPSWKREHVAMGTNTDPYQWVEGRYRLMPAIWEALRDSGTPCSVLTKSPLVLRDIELLKEINERSEVSAMLSVPTLDEKAWRATEPHTPHPRKRLEAVAELARAGIPTGILIAPLMPGVNDAPEQVEEIIRLAEEAGAGRIGGIALHLRGEVKDLWFDWLRVNRPDLLPRYERLYSRGAYAPESERRRLSELVSRPGSKRRSLRGSDPGGASEPELRAGNGGDTAAREAGPPRQPRLF